MAGAIRASRKKAKKNKDIIKEKTKSEKQTKVTDRFKPKRSKVTKKKVDSSKE